MDDAAHAVGDSIPRKRVEPSPRDSGGVEHGLALGVGHAEVFGQADAAGLGAGQGEAKLAAVRGIIEAVDTGYKNLWPQIQPVIGVLVGLFNKTGAFKA